MRAGSKQLVNKSAGADLRATKMLIDGRAAVRPDSGEVALGGNRVSRRDLAAGAGASPLRLPADRRAAPPRGDGGQPQAGAPGDAR